MVERKGKNTRLWIWVAASLGVCACFTGAWFWLQEQSVDAGPGSKILLRETRHDFGLIKANEYKEHRIRFTNVGYKPLEIIHQEADCGVSVEIFPPQPLLPGDSAEIILGISGIKQSGELRGMVTLGINNPKEPPVRIEVLAFLPDRGIDQEP